MRRYLPLLALIATCIGTIATSIAFGPQYAPIIYTNPGTYSVPLGDCSVNSMIMITGMTEVATLDFPSTAPIGTVCNASVVGGNYSVTVKSTGAVLAEPDGTFDPDVVCTNDGGNDVYGCGVHLLKISSGVWTCTTDPYGNWIW